MQTALRYVGIVAAAALGAMSGTPASAYEYPLQFTPLGNYEGLVVAGYKIVGKTAVGNCSYTRIVSGSGRDPITTYVPVPQICTWDFYGNLLGIAAGAPSIPTPVKVQGTETIYAKYSNGLYTGADTALSEGGFVFLYGSHYTWITSNAYLVLAQQSYGFTATLKSDGDIPLKITRVKATTALAATPDNPATHVVINSTTCTGLVAAGTTCTVTLTYTDTGLTSPSGLAYDTLTIHLTTNTGLPADFVQHFTLEVPLPSDS